MKILKVPKPLIYARINEETYEVDITSSHDIIVFNIEFFNKLRNIELYIYNIRIFDYEKLLIDVMNANLEGAHLYVFTDLRVKEKIRDFLEQILLPEQNISEQDLKKIELKKYDLTVYPTRNDKIFERTVHELINNYTSNTYEIFRENEKTLENIECAITLNTEEKLQAFINNRLEKYFSSADKFSEYWLNKYVSRIYIGSQLCSLKVTDIEIIKGVILLCARKNLSVTINTSIITEQTMDFIKQLLEMIQYLEVEDDFRNRMEITINDYAVIKIIHDMNSKMKYNLGILFNRRQKDPRYNYRWNYYNTDSVLKENELVCKKFDKIENFYDQFENIEYENNPIGNKYIKKNNTLHFPFYQTNTSRYCPLNAAIIKGDSNKQYNVVACEHFCEKMVYQYSDNIKLIGIGNSNLGIWDVYVEMFEAIREQKLNRIVWDFI